MKGGLAGRGFGKTSCRLEGIRVREGKMAKLTLVTGAGGFIGGQLVRDLLRQDIAVRAVDKAFKRLVLPFRQF